MKSKIKAVAILSTVCVLILGIVFSSVVQASYYSENSKDAHNLMLANMFRAAARRCIASGKMRQFVDDGGLNLSDRSDSEKESMISSFLNFGGWGDKEGGGMFERKGDGASYSAILESKTPGGYDDGIVWCDELQLITRIMRSLDIDDIEHKDKLLCNGENPGIVNISVDFLGTSGLGGETGQQLILNQIAGITGSYNRYDCQANLNLARAYLARPNERISPAIGVFANGEEEFPFVISIEPNNNRVDHFDRFFNEFLGVDNEILAPMDALRYWQYRDTFNVACATINNGNSVPPLSTSGNMVGIYDALSKKIYYHDADSVNRDRSVYYQVINEDQKTCQWFAEQLGADFSAVDSIDSVKIKSLVKSTQQDGIDSCVEKYKEGREEIEKYYDDYIEIAERGEKFIKAISDMYNAVFDFYGDGGVVSYENIFPSDSLVPEHNEETGISSYGAYLQSLAEKIEEGVNGKQVFTNSRIYELNSLSNTLVEKTEFVYDDALGHWYVKSTDMIGTEFRQISDLLNAVSGEYRKVVADAVALEGLLDKYPAYNGSVDNIWDVNIEDGNATIACIGVDNMISDVAALGLSSAPDIDDWTPPSTVNPGDWQSGSEANCMNSGASGSLGWVICPILDWMGRAAEDVYTDFVEPSLRIEPKMFNMESDAGTKQGWSIFQGFANVMFVILLLAVIFSQLTGVGIDNYGVKKILPKLIIVAILVNLSYYICLVCVDLSNILGSGLKALFDSLPASVPTSVTSAISSSGAGMGLLSVGLLTAMVVIGAWMVWENPAMLLSLLVGALGVLISILFLFVLLAGREAAVVVLTVISPLAFVCYTLPNTKKLFDKWLKLGEGLLLVYPICGLLVGGGNYASRLLLAAGAANNSFVGALTAMLMGIVPIFFIPTVLKGSFAAMGNIGARISGFGKQLSGGVRRGIKGTEGYKAAQKRGYDRKTRIKAGYNSKGQVTRRGAIKARFASSGLGKAIGYQGLQSARVAAANKNREADIQAGAELGDMVTKYDKARKGGTTKNDEQIFESNLTAAIASGNWNKIFSTIEQAKRTNIQASKIAEVTRRQIGASGTKLGRSFLEEFGKRYSGDFLKKDFEQADWARKGGIDGVGHTLSNLAGWAGNNIAIDDLKDEDVAALSSTNLHDLISSGKISQAQAQRVWAANGNMDDTNRLILGAYGNAGRTITKKDAQDALKGIYTGTAAWLTDDSRRAYTERAAMDTRIRDVEWRDRQGRHQQTDDLYVDHRNRPPTTPPMNIGGPSGADGIPE